jgi:hypothetical protein
VSGPGLRERLGPGERWLRDRRRRMQRWRMRAQLDFRDWRRGERDPMVPPRRKNLPSQITAVGEKLVALMIEPR